MQHLMQNSAATLKKMCQDAGLETKNTKIEKAKHLSALGAAKCYEMLSKTEPEATSRGQKRPRGETEEDKTRPETEATSSIETHS